MIQKRILVLEPSGSRWGSENVLLDLLRAMRLDEWSIAVCCPPNTPILDELAKLEVPTYPCFIAGLHRKGRVSRVVALARLIRAVLRFRPDMIYVNQSGVTRIALLAARILNLPVVCSVKLFEDVEYLGKLRPTTCQVHKIICVSEAIKKAFLEKTDIPNHQLATVYDPYLPTFPWDSLPSVYDSRQNTSFACVARLAPSKGQDMVLHALAELKKRNIAATVIMVGSAEDAGYEKELHALASKLNVEDRVRWMGTRQDFFAVTERCFAWLCPSKYDPFPRVTLAALDAGSFPIACTGSGGPAELIQKSGGGLLYPEQTGTSLAEAMLKAMEMPARQRKKFAIDGRAWVSENCAPTNAATQTQAIWIDAINAKISRKTR